MIFIIVFLAACVVGYLYLCKKFSQIFIKTSSKKIKFFLFLFHLILVIGFLSPRVFRYLGTTPTFVYVLEWIGFTALSLLSFSFFGFLIADIVFFLSTLRKNNRKKEIDIKRRQFLLSGAFFISLFFAGKAFVNSQAIPKIKNVLIPIPNLHPDLLRFSIVHLTDFHIGQTIGRDYAEKVIHRLNEVNPDIVVITGDLGDGFVEQIAKDLEPLKQIKTKYGLYYVTGNHEYYWDANGYIDFIKSIGGIYLENEHKVIKIGQAQVLLAGVPDISIEKFIPNIKSDPKKAVANAPKNVQLKILLAHQSRTALTSAHEGYDLQLSGHTHGGQFWPWTWVVHLFQPFSSGLIQVKNMWLYVSRGTGYWGPPARLGSQSEITHIVFARRE